MKKYKVFISYSHVDSFIVEPLVSFLKVANKHIFFDKQTILPGDEWAVSIEKAITHSGAVLLFWCYHSSISQAVKEEYTYAINNSIKLIPLLLDDTPVPLIINKFQWIDLKVIFRPVHDIIAHEKQPPSQERFHLYRNYKYTNLMPFEKLMSMDQNIKTNLLPALEMIVKRIIK
jgi:hypothetical protein